MLSDLSQFEVAEQAGVSVATISGLENGNGRDTKVETLARIAQVLNVTPNYLMAWEVDPCSPFPILSILNDPRASTPCPDCHAPLHPEQAATNWCPNCRHVETCGPVHCLDCGERLILGVSHPTGECIRKSFARGRSVAYLAQRHQMKVAAVREVLIF